MDFAAFRGILANLLFGTIFQFACTVALAQVSEELRVDGMVETALRLTVDDLKAFQAAQIASVSVSRHIDDRVAISSLKGVRLTAILERAGLDASDHHDWKHTIVVASGTDGYRVVFSWAELFNTDIGTDVLAAFERDGQPLGDREGRIALVSARDWRTGPRSVHWLTHLNVRILKD